MHAVGACVCTGELDDAIEALVLAVAEHTANAHVADARRETERELSEDTLAAVVVVKNEAVVSTVVLVRK